MNIKLVNLHKQFQPLRNEILTEIGRVFDDMQLLFGEHVRAFEQEFAAYCGVQHAIGVANGTDALTLALRGLGIGPGHEVITVSHTFIATVEAIALVGATPVLVDINASDFTMNIEQVEAAITPRTGAILPVHLYGQAADMDRLREIADRHAIPVIEDASQAHGCEYRGRRAGSLGVAGCFSFYVSKNLGACGEAGIVTTNDAALATRIRMLRNHGSTVKYQHDILGTNSRLDELQAVILRVKLRHLDRENDERRRHAALYRHYLDGTGTELPTERGDGKHVYHLFVIRTANRDKLREYLNDHGIETGIHYPIPIHKQKAFERYGGVVPDLRVTEQVVDEILSLPMYPGLTEEEVAYIGQHVRSFNAGAVNMPASAAS